SRSISRDKSKDNNRNNDTLTNIDHQKNNYNIIHKGSKRIYDIQKDTEPQRKNLNDLIEEKKILIDNCGYNINDPLIQKIDSKIAKFTKKNEEMP
ncbi:MAG: hypothetical protein MJ252_09115, partial [archaeon]|nr:hypothetical protein [archaeon]